MVKLIAGTETRAQVLIRPSDLGRDRVDESEVGT